MSHKLTQEEFVQRMHKLHPQINVVGEYKDARTPIKLYCTIHDLYYEQTPDVAKRCKYSCPQCNIEGTASQRRKTNETFLEEVSIAAPNVQILEEYNGANSKMKVRCKKCGHEWYSTPTSLLMGNECKPCAMKYVQNYRIKSHEKFLQEIKERNINADTFEVISKYTKYYEPVRCKCLVCGEEWETMAVNLLRKNSGVCCPYCSMSIPEGKIRHYLKEHGIEYTPQKKYADLIGPGGRLLRYDFYLPDYNLLVEYQGEYHDRSVPHMTDHDWEYQVERDSLKREYAKEHNIPLLEIWYWDFDNIEQILQEKLNL